MNNLSDLLDQCQQNFPAQISGLKMTLINTNKKENIDLEFNNYLFSLMYEVKQYRKLIKKILCNIAR